MDPCIEHPDLYAQCSHISIKTYHCEHVPKHALEEHSPSKAIPIYVLGFGVPAPPPPGALLIFGGWGGLGGARGTQEELGGARGSQKEPGEARGGGAQEARGSQEEPGGARGSQEEPGRARRSQGKPGGARGSQGGPGGARTPTKPTIHPPTPTGGRGGRTPTHSHRGGREKGTRTQGGGHEPWSIYRKVLYDVTVHFDMFRYLCYPPWFFK